jgi:hypothetical protein
LTVVNAAPTIATDAVADPNPVTGLTARLNVLGADDGGEANLTYTWSTIQTPPAAVTFSVNGTNAAKYTTVTFGGPGTYLFSVLIKDVGNLTTTSTVSVTVSDNKVYIPLPGHIQAEDYKTGGEGVGYHDLTTGNTGGAYRNDNVDIQTTTDTDGGYNVGWTQAGEWLAYDVKVAQAGSYSFTARLATGTAGTKTVTVTVDGTTKGTFNLTVNNGWQKFSNVVVNNVSLTAGNHELRILMTTADMNVNYLDVTIQAPPAPTGLSATAANNAQINLSWTDNAGDETRFYVYQSNTSTKPATATATLAANAVTYSATGLTSSTQYFFWVCAYNVIGNSADAAANATTKPAGVEKVTNGAFTTTIANWTTYKDPAATATIAWNAGTIKATITYGGTQVYHVQFTQGITYTAGKTYSLSFDASSPEGNRNISVTQEQGSSDYHAIAGSAPQTIALTNTTRNYTYQFTSTESNAGGRLTFNCGNNAFDVVVDNVSLIEQ